MTRLARGKRGSVSQDETHEQRLRMGKRLRRGAPQRPTRGKPYRRLVVEDHADHVLADFTTQHEAIQWAKARGHNPLVARVRHLKGQKDTGSLAGGLKLVSAPDGFLWPLASMATTLIGSGSASRSPTPICAGDASLPLAVSGKAPTRNRTACKRVPRSGLAPRFVPGDRPPVSTIGRCAE